MSDPRFEMVKIVMFKKYTLVFKKYTLVSLHKVPTIGKNTSEWRPLLTKEIQRE